MSVTEEPIILRTPVLVSHNNNHRFVWITRMLSWLTAALLTAALIVALVSITAERNELRDKLGKESKELVCRTVAAVDVTKAIVSRDTTLANALIAASENDTELLTQLIVELKQKTAAVDVALGQEEIALVKCANL